MVTLTFKSTWILKLETHTMSSFDGMFMYMNFVFACVNMQIRFVFMQRSCFTYAAFEICKLNHNHHLEPGKGEVK